MFRAFVLGLSISLMIVGLEGLAIESVLIAPPELLHGADTQSIRVQITELAAWLAIGLGTSLAIYTIFSRKPSKNRAMTAVINTPSPTSLQLADLDYDGQDNSTALIGQVAVGRQEDSKNELDEAFQTYDETELEDDELDDELEDEFEDDELGEEFEEGHVGPDEIEEEDSVDGFDLDAFNEEFDIDDLLDE